MSVSDALVFVSDMQRSVSFYRDGVGLQLGFETPEWTEFATEGATLALHASQQPGSRADTPYESPPGACRPGLSVPKLDRFHGRMLENNVICVQEPKDVFGARIAQCLHPDGLVISVSEQRSVG